MKRLWFLAVLAACGHQRPQQTAGDAATGAGDSGVDSRLGGDGGLGGDGNLGGDGGAGHDAGTTVDASTAHDAGSMQDAPTGIITGGPCLSGAAGATAYRVRWQDGGG